MGVVRVAVVLIDQVPFRHALPAAELKDVLATVKGDRAFTKVRVKDLSEALKAGDELGKAVAIAQLTGDPRVMLTSAIRANKSLPGKTRAPLEQVLKVAETLDLSKPIKEPVRCWPKPKKSGGHRVIHDHGLMHRTGQDLVKRVMEVAYKPRHFQYTLLGLHAAIARVKTLITSGFTHVAHLDVQDFYGNFKLENLLNELPLPAGAVTHVVVGRHQEVVWTQDVSKSGHGLSSLPHTFDHLDTQARQGMPQGSACSPIIGASGIPSFRERPDFGAFWPSGGANREP
jgi:hypothetical protein